MKKRQLKNWVIVSIFLIIVLIILAFVVFFSRQIYYQFKPKRHTGDLLVSYTTNDKLSYKVSVLENHYYVDEYIEMGKQYVGSVVDKIIFDVEYTIDASQLLDFEYDYFVKATLIGNYSTDSQKPNELWSKQYDIIEEVTESLSDTNQFVIKKTFAIDYQTFNTIMEQFKQEFGLTIDASLQVQFVTHVRSEISDNTIAETETMTATIPLLKPTFYITYNTLGNNTNNIYTQQIDIEPNYLYVLLYTALDIIGLYLVIRFLIVLNGLSQKDAFYKKFDKIIKNYNSVLAQVETLPNHEKLQVLNVLRFEDMLDIEEELRVPILYQLKDTEK